MHLVLEKTINASADDVWKVLGTEFAEIDKWAEFVKTSRPLAANEVPEGIKADPNAPVPGRETMTKVKIVEVLTAYSDENRSLTFEGIGLPKIITKAQDTQSVKATGPSTSTVSFVIDFDFLGPFAVLSPIMESRMSKTFTEILDDLKRHVETSR